MSTKERARERNTEEGKEAERGERLQSKQKGKDTK